MSSEREELLMEMMEWARGERSHWNRVCNTSDDRLAELQACAVMDAQEVVKLAAAVNAIPVVPAIRTESQRTEREELALLIRSSSNGGDYGEDIPHVDRLHVHKAVDAILAAGYSKPTPPHRTT